jgi:hypothetical protein
MVSFLCSKIYEAERRNVSHGWDMLFYFCISNGGSHRAFHAKLGLNGRRKDKSLQAAKSDRQLLDQK